MSLGFADREGLLCLAGWVDRGDPIHCVEYFSGVESIVKAFREVG